MFVSDNRVWYFPFDLESYDVWEAFRIQGFIYVPKKNSIALIQNKVLDLHRHRGIRVRDDNPFCFGSFEPLQLSHRTCGGFSIFPVALFPKRFKKQL